MNQTHAAEMLAKLWRKYFRGDSPTIWEIGSRDGSDALILTRFFPRSRVWAFEPNPMTFEKVAKSASMEPRIQPMNLALSDEDGPVTFFQIDPELTTTTWTDGNPGASSLFRASGNYQIETYVQRPISVDAARGDTLVRRGQAESPDLMWMDVQGAEALVLSGLGNLLERVSMIYVELSLREIYHGQALAPEVVVYLQNHGFSWHSVPRKGTWQFDALFLRTGRRPSAMIRNRMLTLSLRSGIGIGISHGATGAMRAGIRRARTLRPRVSSAVLSPLESIESRHLDGFTDRCLRVRQPQRSGPASSKVRRIYESSRRSDPLKSEKSLPLIDVVVPCAAKDLTTLLCCVVAARQNSSGPVGKVIVVAPLDVVDAASAVVGDLATVVDESSLGIDAVFACIDNTVPSQRRGWVLQQVLKLAVAAQSTAQGVLVVDADTLLTRERSWLVDGQQVLAVGHAFHNPYAKHSALVFGENGRSQRISYVTHHQLMQPSVVRTMLSAAAGGSTTDGFVERGLVAWVLAADYSEGAALSEYHSYGTWMMNTVPHSVHLVRWGNVAISSSPPPVTSTSEAEELLAALRAQYRRAFSVSFHSYLNTSR